MISILLLIGNKYLEGILGYTHSQSSAAPENQLVTASNGKLFIAFKKMPKPKKKDDYKELSATLV